MRLFIAVDFPVEIKDGIIQSITPLRNKFPQISWTKKENIHLTLKFLGNIKEKSEIQNYKENMVEKIKKGIEESIKGIKPFELVFDKVGYFAREQLIIWLGAKADTQLSLLIERLDKEIEKLGFKKERREFTPHLTVGRGKRLDRVILKKIKHEIVSGEFILPKTFTVSGVVLMESLLTPKGPIYKPLEKFALG